MRAALLLPGLLFSGGNVGIPCRLDRILNRVSLSISTITLSLSYGDCVIFSFASNSLSEPFGEAKNVASLRCRSVEDGVDVLGDRSVPQGCLLWEITLPKPSSGVSVEAWSMRS